MAAKKKAASKPAPKAKAKVKSKAKAKAKAKKAKVSKKKKTKKSAKASRKRKKKGRRGGLAILVIMIVSLIAAVVVFKKIQPVPENNVVVRAAGVIGSTGKGDGQLQSPRGISAAPDGSLAVTDLGNSRINVYEPDGKFRLTFGKLGEEGAPNKGGDFREASGVSFGPRGEIFVADAWNGRIQRFSAEGKFLQEYKADPYNFYSPRNVVVDKRGNIYVADTGNSQVKVFPTAGGKPKIVGARGEGGGHFKEVFGLALNSKNEIFVADPGNKRIHKFASLPSAGFITSVKVPGWKTNSPFWPHITIDAKNNVFVADGVNQKIWVYDQNLKYLATLGGQEGQQPFGSPLGIAAAPGGKLYVADMNGNRIIRLALPPIKALP